jgi:type IV pilus assembly protein PilA
MTDWYYHDPSQGRVGPYAAADIRNRFRDRLIQRDTLVWHSGMREWQPLDRQSEALELEGVQPDMSLPPPLPPAAPTSARSYGATRSAPSYANARRDTGAKRGLSGCAIVAIVAVALIVPVGGILAAIAIPAYQDYTIRARAMSGVAGAASAIEEAVAEHVARSGQCPGNADMAPLAQRFASLQPSTRLKFGAVEGGNCAFEFTLGGISPKVDGRTWLYVSYREGDQLAWDCTGGDLPARYRPAMCRPDPQGTASP